jgi:hypothetical protein
MSYRNQASLVSDKVPIELNATEQDMLFRMGQRYFPCLPIVPKLGELSKPLQIGIGNT